MQEFCTNFETTVRKNSISFFHLYLFHMADFRLFAKRNTIRERWAKQNGIRAKKRWKKANQPSQQTNKHGSIYFLLAYILFSCSSFSVITKSCKGVNLWVIVHLASVEQKDVVMNSSWAGWNRIQPWFACVCNTTDDFLHGFTIKDFSYPKFNPRCSRTELGSVTNWEPVADCSNEARLSRCAVHLFTRYRWAHSQMFRATSAVFVGSGNRYRP